MQKQNIKQIRLDTFNDNNKFISKKEFYIETNLISVWLCKFYDKNSQILAWLFLPSADRQIQNGIYFTKNPTQSDIKQHKLAQITL